MIKFKQAELRDGNMTLKDITIDHVQEMHEMLSDEYLCDKAGLMTHTHINQTLDFIYEGNEGVELGRQYFYGIYIDDRLIGLINLFNIDFIKNSGEYGYFINSNETRRGYMARAIKLLSNYLLKNTRLETINVYVDVSNKASLALALKLKLKKASRSVEEDQKNRSIEMIRFTIEEEIK